MVKQEDRSSVRVYSDALILLFNNNNIKDVAIFLESGGYVLCLVIRNGKTEIIVCSLGSADMGDKDKNYV